MGVKLLNTFLRTKCVSPNSITKRHIQELSGMKIAVDTSIYMYRFIGDHALLENFYLMCSIFRKYKITPVFIFDGKPPKEKNDELEERKKAKKKAEKEYKYLKKMHENENDQLAKQELEVKMDKMRKKFIRIKNKHIRSVKELFQNYGMSYIDAPGETDVLCAYFTRAGIVDACLSEDMDMFVYGCPIILRYMSLLKHNCVVYSMNHILHDLQMSEDDFITLCITSGTDYSKKLMKKSTRNIFQYYSVYIKYCNYIRNFELQSGEHDKDIQEDKDSQDEDTVSAIASASVSALDSALVSDPALTLGPTNFDAYLQIHYRIDIGSMREIKELYKVYDPQTSQLFNNDLKLFSNIPIQNSNIRYRELKKQLQENDFVFV
jgi:hypothetical protein